jgi:hypothetical protein
MRPHSPGESQPVGKTAEVVAQDAGIADRENMAFKGTAATYGRTTGLVVATGMGTEIGKIAAMLGRSNPRDTPLQRRLAVLGRWLAAAALVVCAVVFVAGVATGQPAEEMFLTAVSLAVAAIPEGLPAVVTVALGARCPADGHQACGDPPAAGGRDARVGISDLHRQDRHADREPDEGRADVDARRDLHRQRPQVRP